MISRTASTVRLGSRGSLAGRGGPTKLYRNNSWKSDEVNDAQGYLPDDLEDSIPRKQTT